MYKDFIKPDFNKNIINISASLASFLGVKNDKPTSKILDAELKKNFKNVVFIILDGFGINPININLREGSILKSNIKDVLTSTFPSTTANATTTYLTNCYPMEHGWFGWNLYFKKINKVVDLYLNADSYTGESVGNFVSKALPQPPPFYFSNKSEYAVSKVVPPYWHDGDESNRYPFSDVEEGFKHIEEICKREGKQFVYSYFGEPDSTMHKFGVSSKEANEMINKLDHLIKVLSQKVKDTIFVISADHGQTDVEGYLNFYEDKKLYSFLKTKPYLDARTPAFLVKFGKKKKFEKYFNKTYGEDFELFKSEDLINQNFFGPRTKNDYLLGDYIAICKTGKIALISEHSNKFLGHHTSLKEEMLVPLIIIES